VLLQEIARWTQACPAKSGMRPQSDERKPPPARAVHPLCTISVELPCHLGGHMAAYTMIISWEVSAGAAGQVPGRPRQKMVELCGSKASLISFRLHAQGGVNP
jgi:hypothetical protein